MDYRPVPFFLFYFKLESVEVRRLQIVHRKQILIIFVTHREAQFASN